MPSNSQWTRLRSADKCGGEVTCERERGREGERVGGHDAGEVNGRDTLVPVAAALMARSVRRYCVHSAGLFAFNIASARALGGLGGGAHSRCVEARCFAERPEAMLAGRCAVRVPLATRTRSGYGSRRSGSARPSCSLTTCVGCRGCCPPRVEARPRSEWACWARAARASWDCAGDHRKPPSSRRTHPVRSLS